MLYCYWFFPWSLSFFWHNTNHVFLRCGEQGSTVGCDGVSCSSPASWTLMIQVLFLEHRSLLPVEIKLRYPLWNTEREMVRKEMFWCLSWIVAHFISVWKCLFWIKVVLKLKFSFAKKSITTKNLSFNLSIFYINVLQADHLFLV